MPRNDADRHAQAFLIGKLRRPDPLNVLLLASLLLPLTVFAGIASYDRSQTLGAVYRDLLSTVDTLHGHAESLFQLQALALGATDAWLGQRSDEDIRSSQIANEAYLRTMQRPFAPPLSIAAYSANGHPLLLSDEAEVPPDVDVADRSYFRWHREHKDAVPYIAGPTHHGPDGGEHVFITLRRSVEAIDFQGVITAGIRQSRFLDYWGRATPNPTTMINLTRDDGLILVRRPPPEQEQIATAGSRTAIVQAIRLAGERTVFRRTSMVDGIDRLLVVRKLDRFPVYVSYGIAYAEALSPWYRRLLLYGAFAKAVAVGLVSLALLAKSRSRQLRDLNLSLEARVDERTAELQAGEQRLRLLAREVDHRAKNALAVVQATLRLTAKTNIKTFAKQVEGRVAALARAQTLLADDRWRGASLHALLTSELAGFVSTSSDAPGPRVELQGDPVLIPAAATQPLAMAIHELATNAIKHGALATMEGRVRLSWHVSNGPSEPLGRLTIVWVETGGPIITGAPSTRGFGSRVLEGVVHGQLGGSLSLMWETTGLVCQIDMALSHLSEATLATVN
ncbi:sensor histidine kinase [Muricoccus vinaceus]|uniref:histidine kinase n=1 Tax=Muricoccus vinaceus TaxID=424704 RepID=A0ABV6IT29_9PROT